MKCISTAPVFSTFVLAEWKTISFAMQMYSCSRNEEYHVAFNLHLAPVFVNQSKVFIFVARKFQNRSRNFEMLGIFQRVDWRLRYLKL